MLIERKGYKFETDSLMIFWEGATIIDMIGHLERRILVYSYQYYELGQTVVPDKYYDLVSIYLVEMIERYPEEFRQSSYYYVFEDFDGSTGFDLYYRLTDDDRDRIEQIAFSVLDRYNRRSHIIIEAKDA